MIQKYFKVFISGLLPLFPSLSRSQDMIKVRAILVVLSLYFGVTVVQAGNGLSVLEEQTADSLTAELDVDSVFTLVDVDSQPEFPGGDAALSAFLKKNIKYPEFAKDYNIEGRVIVSFIVERDGSISEIEIAKTLQSSLDEEACRLVSVMPDWKPGMKDGEAVRVANSLPVNFRLDEANDQADVTLNQGQNIEKYSFSSLVTKISNGSKSMTTPSVVDDPADETNKCLLLKTPASPGSGRDSQLYLYCKKPFNMGDTIHFSIMVKGKEKQSVSSELHSTPGNLLIESPFERSQIGTDWTQLSGLYIVSSTNAQTIVLNMADLKDGNDCYFDDMKIEVHHAMDIIEKPTFPGGVSALTDYLREHNKYPAPGRGKAVFADVLFNVETDGTIHNPRVVVGLDSLHNEEAIRLVSEMPEWNPGKKNGELTAFNVTIPIEFDNTNVPLVRENPQSQIFMVAEDMPQFPGGTEALLAYIRQNIKYPAICRETNVQGRVIVSFVVNKEGYIVDPEVVKGVHPSLDKEALRVIWAMPKWIPGTLRGKPVNVKYNVPINFRLN